MRTFLRELRRRNVYRVGATYAVVGWLAVQIATQVLPVYDVSPLVLRVIVSLIIAGFPIALMLSWIYELTPQGIVRTSEVAPDASITLHTGRKLDIVIVVLLALAILLLITQRWWHPQNTGAANAAVNEKSVAVMPFENLSDDKSNAFFAEGIQDEILTRLAKIGALKVISRTSTRHYASSPDDLPEIARQLGVAHILEGSVQKVGDAVHINVQLIHAATDQHVWAETYNRTLVDIFAVEGEVAGAIAEALNAKLTGAEQIAVTTKPTENVAAAEAYLRGRALEVSGADFNVARRRADAYSEAVRLDPKFAPAWAGLAVAEGYLYFNGVDPTRFTADTIHVATETAMRLQPESSESLVAQGFYRYRVLRDYASAQASFEAALRQSPNSAQALQALGLVERRQGRWDEAIAHARQSSVLNPRDAGLMIVIGETLLVTGRTNDAREWLDRALALEPRDTQAIGLKAMTYLVEGRTEEASRVIDAIPATDVDMNFRLYRTATRMLQHRYADVIAELQPLVAQPFASLDGFGPLFAQTLAFAELGIGNRAAARATFENILVQTEPHADQVDDTLTIPTRAIAAANSGRSDEAFALARRGIEVFGNDALMRPYADAALAQVQAITGDIDAAIATVESLLTRPSYFTKPMLRLDPAWDPLRRDARFTKLIAAASPATEAPANAKR